MSEQTKLYEEALRLAVAAQDAAGRRLDNLATAVGWDNQSFLAAQANLSAGRQAWKESDFATAMNKLTQARLDFDAVQSMPTLHSM
jgi:hypothetical protein